MKKVFLKIITLSLMIAALNALSFAQTRIRFARGRSAATLSGTIPTGSTREYVIGVREGQTMTVQVTSGNNKLDLEITGQNGHLEWGDNGFAQVDINESGDHYITIKNSGRATTKYSLTVTVR